MQPHVIVFPFPFASHTGSLLALFVKLAAAAPAVDFTIFTTPMARATISRATLSSCEQLPNLLLRDLPDDGVVPDGFLPPAEREKVVEMFLTAAPSVCRRAVEGLAQMPAATCVVSDLFMFCTGEMAKEMGLPWVGIWTSTGTALLGHYYTDSIRQTIGVGQHDLQAKQDTRIDFVPCMSNILVRDLQHFILTGNLDSTFAQALHKMGQVWLQAAVVVVNTFEGLESTVIDHMRTLSNKMVLPLAPFSLVAPPSSKSDTNGCLAWLDKIGKLGSVVYVAFSLVAMPPPSELAALAEGLEESAAQFLWSLSEEAWVNLPVGFLERTRDKGLVVPWAPQSMVLEHSAVGAFFTHCGWNSVMESINGGLPMIVRPLLADNMLNARLVSDMWGIGIGFDGGIITKVGVVQALDLVLNKDEGKKMRENVKALKELALKAVSKDGSSSKSFDALIEFVLKGRE